VADFGLAAIKPKAKKTIRADPRGTPLTRAPEVLLAPFSFSFSFPIFFFPFLNARARADHAGQAVQPNG
jgi:hypothetical protein